MRKKSAQLGSKKRRTDLQEGEVPTNNTETRIGAMAKKGGGGDVRGLMEKKGSKLH